jgi:hypothetical protein
VTYRHNSSPKFKNTELLDVFNNSDPPECNHKVELSRLSDQTSKTEGGFASIR